MGVIPWSTGAPKIVGKTIRHTLKTNAHYPYDLAFCPYMYRYNLLFPSCSHEGPHKPVTRRIFIVPDPDQILPVAMFNYYTTNYPRECLPTSDEMVRFLISAIILTA